MLSNEAKALGRAIDTIQKALDGSAYENAVKICGGREYGDVRELCARIVGIADKIKAGGLSTGGGGGIDQIARELAQTALDILDGKANKIVQQEQVQDQTMFDYMHMPVPSIIELPAGTLHTTTVVNSDITEILGFTPSPQPGPNFSQVSFKSVSGDFYVQYKVTTGRRPDLPCTISLFQKKPDGSFQEHNIYNGSVMGGGTINNQTIAQIDWLQFANYDMSFDIRNISMTVAQARELNLWKHITRGHVSQSLKDLADARDDILGEVVSMRSTLQAKDADIESKITLYEKVTQSELEDMIADPELAQEGVIYKVGDGTGTAMRMYIKDGDVMKELGGGGTAAIMALITDLQARIDALENP